MFLLQGVACLLLGLVVRVAYIGVRRGHVAALTDCIVVTVTGVLLLVVAVLEVVRLLSWPLRSLLGRLMGLVVKKKKSPAPVPRRVVIFDGVCVLCNVFGRFVVGRLPNAGQINFVPFQDPKSNPHVNLPRLIEEFKFDTAQLQNRIAVVSGTNLLWGADAVLEIFSWCVWPYPLMQVGKVVPAALRDTLYLTVASNRYAYFGTQALDKNFAKKLCPYYWFKGVPRGAKKAAAGGAGGAKKAAD